jgi:hypothetical protein
MQTALAVLAAYLLGVMAAKPSGRSDAHRVEAILSQECGVSL